MITRALHLDDAYLKDADAIVVSVEPGEGGVGVVLDRSPFYATGGGQPGDEGWLELEDGARLRVAACRKGSDGGAVHVLEAGAAEPPVGAAVRAILDWPKRHARMRAHTALHLLSVALPYAVTGGLVGEGEGRLDFDIPEGSPDREALAAQLAAFVAADAPVTARWITDAELDANPGLVKTMKVKPPRGTGTVRLVAIENIDLQPCGGTHVRRTGEIGAIEVAGIEKKGRQNRRVRIKLA